jgi:hypothetical protein
MVINNDSACLPVPKDGHSGTAWCHNGNTVVPTRVVFLPLVHNAYAVSVSTLSTRAAARIMREDMDTIGRNSRHKKT